MNQMIQRFLKNQMSQMNQKFQKNQMNQMNQRFQKSLRCLQFQKGQLLLLGLSLLYYLEAQ